MVSVWPDLEVALHALAPREHERSSGGQCVPVRYSVSRLKLNIFLAFVKLELLKNGILESCMYSGDLKVPGSGVYIYLQEVA